MNERQFKEITTWQKETFGQATAVSKVHHLIKEAYELLADLQSNAENRRLEFADCFILLAGAAASDGMSYKDIQHAIEEKMLINYQRKWGKPDSNGVVQHIEDSEDEDNEFQPCSNCDGHPACEDFGCAIKAGIIIPNWPL